MLSASHRSRWSGDVKTAQVARPTLQTARLELTPLSEEHLELEVEPDSDPEVLRYLDGRALTRAEVRRAHRRRLRAGEAIPGLGVWVGFHAGEFVGCWMLQPPHGPDQRQVPGKAALGYRLLRRWWRRGLASEGANELLRPGCVDVGLRRIFAQTLAVNRPPRAVMVSIGMTYLRSFPSQSPEPLVVGSDRGEIEYEITRERWAADRGLGESRDPASGRDASAATAPTETAAASPFRHSRSDCRSSPRPEALGIGPARRRRSAS